MINITFIRVIILLVISTLCDTSSYACNKSAVPCGCGRAIVGINARIINGEDAIPYSWPMVVSLRDNLGSATHFCGGTILSESYILTAAHCVDRFPSDLSLGNMTIAAGIHNLSQSDRIIRQIDQIIIHPLWDILHAYTQYDIAILHLAEPLDLEANSSITRTCIPPRSNTTEEIMQYPLNGTSLVVIGWGVDTAGSIPDTLQQVTINSIHHTDYVCAPTIYDPDAQFCAGLHQGGKGDSGGPIFQWIGDRWMQVGIVSYGVMGCAARGYASVFTRISYFKDWIDSYIYNNNQTTVSDNKTINSRILYQCYQGSAQCSCGLRNVELSPSTIVTSENAVPYSWPMIVSIRDNINNEHICAGTILEDSYILTAAHCVANRSAQFLTIVASIYYSSDSRAIIRQVDSISIHPNYTAGSDLFINDIAILHLSRSLNFKKNRLISRACMSSIYNQWMNGTRLVVSGWNMTNMSSFPRAVLLQQAEVYAIDGVNSNCFVSNNQSPTQFCAGHYGSNKEACYGGDFGNPIFQWNNNHWVQIGLASYCKISRGHGVFTRLATYSDWINSTLYLSNNKSTVVYQCDKTAPCGCGQADVVIAASPTAGREDAIEHSWSMIVTIQRDKSHLCGGTILSDSFILTSATCIKYYIYFYNLTVVAGIHSLSETVTTSRTVDRVYLHPNYSSEQSHLYDIAIVHLDHPLPLGDKSLKLTKTSVPIGNELPANQYPEPNSTLIAIGWNDYWLDGTQLDTLQQIPLRLMNNNHEWCSNSIIIDTYEFCAGLPSGNKSEEIYYSCHDYSGGPVLMYKNSHWEQVSE